MIVMMSRMGGEQNNLSNYSSNARDHPLNSNSSGSSGSIAIDAESHFEIEEETTNNHISCNNNDHNQTQQTGLLENMEVEMDTIDRINRIQGQSYLQKENSIEHDHIAITKQYSNLPLSTLQSELNTQPSLEQQQQQIINNTSPEQSDLQQEQINSTFIAFTERPRSDSQVVPNTYIESKEEQTNIEEEEQHLKLFNKADSDTNNKRDQSINTQVGYISSEKVRQIESILYSSQEQLQQAHSQQNNHNNEKNSLILNNASFNQNASHDMDDELSNSSTSAPSKKQKKSICKVSSSPQQSSLQHNAKQSTVNRKKSHTISTSIFSTSSLSLKKQQLQLNRLKDSSTINFNNSDIIQLESLRTDCTSYNKENTNNNNNMNEDSIQVGNKEENGIPTKQNKQNQKQKKESSKIKENNSNEQLNNLEESLQQQQSQQQQENQSKKIRFTPEEDSALINLIKIHGKKWRVISELMNGKNETRIRNRYYSHIRKILKPGEICSPSMTPVSLPLKPEEEAEEGTAEQPQFDQLNLNKAVISNQNNYSSNNPESSSSNYQESQLYPHNQTTTILKVNNRSSNAKENNIQKQQQHHSTGQFSLQSTTCQDDVSLQSSKKFHHIGSSNNEQYHTNQNTGEHLNLQQSTQPDAPPQYTYFNSNLFDSLNLLTLNNLEREFNPANYDNHFDDLHFQSNMHDPLLIQSNHLLPIQYPFSSNNLNFDMQNHKIPSFKFYNGMEGSVANFKTSVNNFEAIETEDYTHKPYLNSAEKQNTIFTLQGKVNEDEERKPEQHQHHHLAPLPKKQQNLDDNFCPNKFIKSSSGIPAYLEEPSPLIFSKLNGKKYDPNRFANVNVHQAFNQVNQGPASSYSIEENNIEEMNTNDQTLFHNPHNSEEQQIQPILNDGDKLQKIKFLNTQLESIQSLIEQCKQEILKEIIFKNKRNV